MSAKLLVRDATEVAKDVVDEGAIVIAEDQVSTTVTPHTRGPALAFDVLPMRLKPRVATAGPCLHVGQSKLA